MSWHEAAAYCNAVSTKAGKTPCYTCSGSGAGVTCQEAAAYSGKKIYTCPGYRLPTEAEWEHAYRAGTTTAFYNGDITACTGAGPNLDKIGWYASNSGKTNHAVGQKQANAWKLYDMAGNVYEWCHDVYSSYPSTSVSDPVGTSGSYRVFRGGSSNMTAAWARAASRRSAPPDIRDGMIGFRVARSVP